MSAALQAAGVLLAMFVTDFLWTRYIIAAAQHDRLPASLYSAAIVAAGGITTLAVVSSPWFMIPASIGAFLGTWYSTR